MEETHGVQRGNCSTLRDETAGLVQAALRWMCNNASQPTVQCPQYISPSALAASVRERSRLQYDRKRAVGMQLWVAQAIGLVSEFDYCMCTRKYSFSNKQVSTPTAASPARLLCPDGPAPQQCLAVAIRCG
jgi:hypothetical protein